MLERPIFIVGHARGGSTLLASLINWHSHVGPKSDLLKSSSDINELLSLVYQPEWHIQYSQKLEQKELWSRLYADPVVFTDMGIELVNERPLDDHLKSELVDEMLSGFSQHRRLVKSPPLSFKVKSISAMFPDAKFVAILRKGEEVVSSWGKRHYGFGRRVSWGEMESENLSFMDGISVFTRKWLETITYLDSISRLVNMHFVSYFDLTHRPLVALRSLFDFLELPHEDYINDLSFNLDPNKWKEGMPVWARIMLLQKVRRGNHKIRLLTEPGYR